MAQSIASKIRSLLVKAVASQAGVDAAQVTLDGKRAGMYTYCVLAAITAAGDKAVFITACEALMVEFRSNTRGIAVKYNVEQAMTKQGNPATDSDGNPVYKVPGSLSTAKSTLGRGFDNDIDMGSIKNPGAFSAIRDAASVAAAEQATANATPADKVRASIRASLATIEASLAKLDHAPLKALNTLLNAAAKSTQAVTPASRKRAAKA
jgi:hypothetical protein